jgi:VanZ family protein
MTHGQTIYHAVVIWYYAKYFVQEFVLKKSDGGNPKCAGTAGVFSQALYESLTEFVQWFIPEFVSLLVA